MRWWKLEKKFNLHYSEGILFVCLLVCDVKIAKHQEFSGRKIQQNDHCRNRNEKQKQKNLEKEFKSKQKKSKTNRIFLNRKDKQEMFEMYQKKPTKQTTYIRQKKKRKLFIQKKKDIFFQQGIWKKWIKTKQNKKKKHGF